MDNNQKWINEVMSQNVDASIGEDYTRLALNFVFIKDNIFENKIYLKDIKNHKTIKSDNLKIDYAEDIIIVLDDLQDPGNLGTILRTIDSANLKQIIISKNSADSYSPKVVRSTMGAIFRVNIIEVDNLAETLKQVQKNKFEVIVTALDATSNIYNIEYKNKVIVIGNEANGVSKEVQNLANQKVKIPMLGKTESLNASVAASIMIYEYVRRNCQ